MVKDIDNVDIIKPCDFVLYFDDEIWRDVLLELVFYDGLDSFAGSEISLRLIFFRFASWSCDVGNGRPDGDVVDTWIEGNDVVNAGANKLFRIGHS